MKRQTIKFTQEGFENLQKEHTDLQEKRKIAVQELAHARSMGDLSENAAYTAARRKLSSIDSRLRYLAFTMRNAEVVAQISNGKIDLGSRVIVDEAGEQKLFIIVGSHESNLAENKLSCVSPIGRALMGKKVGDRVDIRIPAGMISFTILKVE